MSDILGVGFSITFIQNKIGTVAKNNMSLIHRNIRTPFIEQGWNMMLGAQRKQNFLKLARTVENAGHKNKKCSTVSSTPSTHNVHRRSFYTRDRRPFSTFNMHMLQDTQMRNAPRFPQRPLHITYTDDHYIHVTDTLFPHLACTRRSGG